MSLYMSEVVSHMVKLPEGWISPAGLCCLCDSCREIAVIVYGYRKREWDGDRNRGNTQWVCTQGHGAVRVRYQETLAFGSIDIWGFLSILIKGRTGTYGLIKFLQGCFIGPCLYKDGSQNWGLFAHLYIPFLGLKGLTMWMYGSYS